MELVFWLLIGVLLVTALIKAATPKGVVGERRVQRLTDRGLNQDVYRSLHDLILPTPDGSTQIDHVIVSQFGVFVIETKNLAGWIFGDERSRQWTQTLYRKKYRFQNPLRQNYKHVKAVEKIAGLHFNDAFTFRHKVPPSRHRGAFQIICSSEATQHGLGASRRIALYSILLPGLGETALLEENSR